MTDGCDFVKIIDECDIDECDTYVKLSELRLFVGDLVILYEDYDVEILVVTGITTYEHVKGVIDIETRSGATLWENTHAGECHDLNLVRAKVVR